MNKYATPITLSADFSLVDAHVVKPVEYKELPELTDEMLRRAVVKKGGRPRFASPMQLISLRLLVGVIFNWRATGPGWQTRMADRLARAHVARASRET